MLNRIRTPKGNGSRWVAREMKNYNMATSTTNSFGSLHSPPLHSTRRRLKCCKFISRSENTNTTWCSSPKWSLSMTIYALAWKNRISGNSWTDMRWQLTRRRRSSRQGSTVWTLSGLASKWSFTMIWVANTATTLSLYLMEKPRKRSNAPRRRICESGQQKLRRRESPWRRN